MSWILSEAIREGAIVVYESEMTASAKSTREENRGAQPPEEMVREAIRTGAVPGRLPDTVFGGLSTGVRCVLCGRSIPSGEVELILEFADEACAGRVASRVQAHPRCFLLFKVAVERGRASAHRATTHPVELAHAKTGQGKNR